MRALLSILLFASLNLTAAQAVDTQVFNVGMCEVLEKTLLQEYSDVNPGYTHDEGIGLIVEAIDEYQVKVQNEAQIALDRSALNSDLKLIKDRNPFNVDEFNKLSGGEKLYAYQVRDLVIKQLPIHFNVIEQNSATGVLISPMWTEILGNGSVVMEVQSTVKFGMTSPGKSQRDSLLGSLHISSDKNGEFKTTFKIKGIIIGYFNDYASSLKDRKVLNNFKRIFKGKVVIEEKDIARLRARNKSDELMKARVLARSLPKQCLELKDKVSKDLSRVDRKNRGESGLGFNKLKLINNGNSETVASSSTKGSN